MSQTSRVAEQSSRLVIYDNLYWELLQVLYTMLLHYLYSSYKIVSSPRVLTSFPARLSCETLLSRSLHVHIQ